ncbi:hypothetical protein [Chitinivibrio alkaliphilus]|uniref:Lipoprotein n=1 Tax=Chitinivibrio alkaliphilus ACht1 TaxID=1313304 RepID=U7DAS5_9BACT|nr:hypothetical protein [Chitinivibrio alkaliphilus]ERP39132.1 hypothetical protein CALK_0299 [Chitinivibrio alkaliphilus ACht1]
MRRLYLLVTVLFLSSCMRYMTHERQEARVEHIDISQTLLVAEQMMQSTDRRNSLVFWVIKDQELTAEEAARIGELYFTYKDNIETSFDQWHFTWAIANMYRLGDSAVQHELSYAYADALQWAQDLGRRGKRATRDTTIYMGDAHSGGRLFARRHIVAPGNDSYLQSAEEYFRREGIPYTKE